MNYRAVRKTEFLGFGAWIKSVPDKFHSGLGYSLMNVFPVQIRGVTLQLHHHFVAGSTRIGCTTIWRTTAILRRPWRVLLYDAIVTLLPTATASTTDAPDGLGPSAYQLAHQPDGSSLTVRENLSDITIRELLGPIGGPTELLPASPRTIYLVGHIAPWKLTNDQLDLEQAEDGPELIEVRADPDATRQAGLPALAADDASADDEQDSVHDQAPKQGLMIPASMGLRFHIPADLPEFTITASWGTYASEKSDKVDKKGKSHLHYRRTPMQVTEQIRVGDLTPGQTLRLEVHQKVTLQIDLYRPASGHLLIEVALCNNRVTPTTIPVGDWLYQTQVRVTADQPESFLPVQDLLDPATTWDEPDQELKRLGLQYRDRLEFAIGRTCSADWDVTPGRRRANSVHTTWLPTSETPPTRAGLVPGALLGMDALATASVDALRVGLAPIVDGYARWLTEQAATAAELPETLAETADEILVEAGQTQARLAAGVEFLLGDAQALDCFRFMNHAMRDQRVHTQIAARRSANPKLSLAEASEQVKDLGSAAASWYPFQLAFILIQLPALVHPERSERSGDKESAAPGQKLSAVELLFFPTGGGKTEAYLGLAAFTFAIRRLQGVIESDEGPLTGQTGVAVLMRYTLRLLTSQQFQRATALICAAELIRLADPGTWGSEPFRIGLWVGTDVTPKRWDEAESELANAHRYSGSGRLKVLQFQRCPWCGTAISAKDLSARKADRRVLVFCGDDLARCPFSRGGTANEGLPVLTVDEEIYRLAPAFLIATVDKFARLAREGEAASLFGYVAQRCDRHGYVHPDYQHCDAEKHRAASGFPAASRRPVERLRPPDLIIQDELHLITGALGTAVGLFEVVVETLCLWQLPDQRPVRPLIVASTATVRNASDQVRGLYGRRVEIFPPQVLAVADTFFSRELPVSPEHPGRRYLGVCAQGVRLSSAEIRVAEVLLSAGQLLLDRSGVAADPYLTLVGYFNATRELASMVRYVNSDVHKRVTQPKAWGGFPRRIGSLGQLNLGELTSRNASGNIGRTLDQLAIGFDAKHYSSAGVAAKKAAREAGQKSEYQDPAPFDVVLATSMLQVGVDVQRLGLMLVVGQPKNTAEYIQASSRVGRDQSKPGLVIALGNWARPRDLAHFEQFRHYHETFYAKVESLSVTPFSVTSLDRGLDAVLVAAIRVSQGHLGGEGLSVETGANAYPQHRPAVAALVARLKRRISQAAQLEAIDQRVAEKFSNKLDHWAQRQTQVAKNGQQLVYEKIGTAKKREALITSPENQAAHPSGTPGPPLTIAHSMREVQPEVNLLVSPLEPKLFAGEAENIPQWELPEVSA